MSVATKPANEGALVALTARPRPDFIETEATRALSERALAYLSANFPVHFCGPAGTGKTTLALHVAAQIGRPVMLIVGDEEFNTSDLIGKQNGYRYRRVVDRYVHSVLKYEEDAILHWVDNRLTAACRYGFTLVYDEFTRSRPETNNILLAVLEEKILVLPNANSKDGYIKVHPNFRAIFTSNPQEYAGVYEVQDALSDRLITLHLDFYERETEIDITVARSGLSRESATAIVDIVRDFRASGEYGQTPTLRASIMIAQVVAMEGIPVSIHNSRFTGICLDVLEGKIAFTLEGRELRTQQRKRLMSLIEHHCSNEI